MVSLGRITNKSKTYIRLYKKTLNKEGFGSNDRETLKEAFNSPLQA